MLSSTTTTTEIASSILTYRQALLESMRNALQKRTDTIIFGQGVDDYRGTFGTTLNLANEFGAHRVFDTPIAEEGMTGIAIGAALNGLYPIQTHIRVDFALLAMNQIVNLAAKYKYMFGGAFVVPMLIRMIIGRSWGQGSQHSQSLQSLFAHIPGLTVIMPATAQAILNNYHFSVMYHRGPVLSIEHRILYDLQFQVPKQEENVDHSPFISYKVKSGKDVTIVATSIMVLEAQRAAEHLLRVAGITCDIIDLHCISHPDVTMILESVKKTGKLLIADTSWKAYGVSAEICRLVCETIPHYLKMPVITLGLKPAPCPTAKNLEDLFYPNQFDMVHAIATLVVGNDRHNIPLPEKASMTDVYKRFKGPF